MPWHRAKVAISVRPFTLNVSKSAQYMYVFNRLVGFAPIWRPNGRSPMPWCHPFIALHQKGNEGKRISHWSSFSLRLGQSDSTSESWTPEMSRLLVFIWVNRALIYLAISSCAIPTTRPSSCKFSETLFVSTILRSLTPTSGRCIPNPSSQPKWRFVYVLRWAPLQTGEAVPVRRSAFDCLFC